MTKWSLNVQEATDSGSVWTGSAGARTPAGWEMGRPCHHQAPSRVANKPVINKALRSRSQARNSSMPPAYLPKKRRRCPMHSAGNVGHEHWPQRTQGPVQGSSRRRQPIMPFCEVCILGGFLPFHVSVTNRSGFGSGFPAHSLWSFGDGRHGAACRSAYVHRLRMVLSPLDPSRLLHPESRCGTAERPLNSGGTAPWFGRLPETRPSESS